MAAKVINLLKNYNKNTLFNLIEPIKNLYFNIQDFNNNITFKKNDYNKSILFRDAKYEIVLICWDSCCQTKIHNHPKNGCIMKILKGTLIEECFNEKNLNIKCNTYNENDVSYIHDDLYLHKIINSNQKSISLHIYSPPNFYD
jgi:cysteine dioxygenase